MASEIPWHYSLSLIFIDLAHSLEKRLFCLFVFSSAVPQRLEDLSSLTGIKPYYGSGGLESFTRLPGNSPILLIVDYEGHLKFRLKTVYINQKLLHCLSLLEVTVLKTLACPYSCFPRKIKVPLDNRE